jgi:hypothetical protein
VGLYRPPLLDPSRAGPRQARLPPADLTGDFVHCDRNAVHMWAFRCSRLRKNKLSNKDVNMRRGAHPYPLAGDRDVDARSYTSRSVDARPYMTRPMRLPKVARFQVERRRSPAELTVERITAELPDDALNNAFEVVVKELCARGICY